MRVGGEGERKKLKASFKVLDSFFIYKSNYIQWMPEANDPLVKYLYRYGISNSFGRVNV